MVLARERAEQRAVAHHVDHARDAVAQAMHFAQRAGRECFGRGACHSHAVLHVASGLVARQRTQVVATRDALRELAQVRLLEQRPQFFLADEDDLQQLGRRGLEVREQAHLLERLETQVLRLVHDQHDALAARMRLEQVMAEQVHQRLGAGATFCRHLQVQFFADREQELGRRDPRVEDQRDLGVTRQLLEQAADHRRLARADLASQLDEAAGLVDAVQQVRQRFGVPLAEVQVAGVRRDRERFFLEAEKACIHMDLGLPWPAGDRNHA